MFYALAAAFRKQGVNVYLGTRPWPAAPCGSCSSYWQVDAEYYTLIFAVLGLLLLVCYRLAMLEWTGLGSNAAFQCANALMSLSFVAAALITLSRLATQLGRHHLFVGRAAGRPWMLSVCWRRGWCRTPHGGDGTWSWRSPRPA